MKPLLFILAFLVAAPLAAQTTTDVLLCQSFPCAATVLWDPVSPSVNQPVEGYRVRLDTVVVEPNVPATTTQWPVTIPTSGLHSVSVRAFNSKGDGPDGSLIFDAQLFQTPTPTTAPSQPPFNVRLRVSVGGGTPTPIPFSVAGHTWLLARDALGHLIIFLDGQPAPDAGPDCTLLVPVANRTTVATFCPDGNWYTWDANPTPPTSHWTNVGATPPKP